MTKKIVALIFIAVFLALAFYLLMPTLQYGFFGLPWLLILMMVLTLFSLGLNRSTKKINGIGKIAALGILIGLVYALIVPLFSTWALFRSDDYRALIGEVQMGEDFSNHVAPISTEEIRIVDQAIAYRLGDKVLGAKPSLGSQAYIGEFTIQKVKGQLYWVAPLLHSGLFKWMNNKEGTPGYVMVSATNERDVQLVDNLNGQPIKIKYQPNAYFGSLLQRHVFFNGYMSTGFTDYTFEIDDDGQPFWVITLYKKKVGFSGEEATGVLTVDASTGAIQEYNIHDAPLWLDRIQPAQFIVEQLDNWGEYVKGYWNFANENKLTTTRGISLVYGQNNKSYWYTGLTSVGADEGTVGFVLVDTRTKETIWYKQVGATETAAQSSGEGKVQEKGYYASFPITYNINGIPTYVMSLKDNGGLVKMIAMVSVQDYTIVGVGNTLNESLRDYKNNLNSKGNAIAPSSEMSSYNNSSRVYRIGQDTRNGNMLFYIQLEGLENKIFIGSTSISNELPLTQIGDSVRVVYDDGGNELIDLMHFDNLNINTQKTEAQKRVEKKRVEKIEVIE